MENSKLRTKAEKILYPIAIIFSALIWIALIGGIIGGSVYNAKKIAAPVTVNPCVYIYKNGYYYVTMEDAKNEGYEDECLDKSKVPANIYASATTELQKQAQQKQVAPAAAAMGFAIGILFYVFIFIIIIYSINALMMAHIRLNGLKLSTKQYKKFYEVYSKAAEELGLKKVPDAYIIHAAGDLNAFAIKISMKKMVVFYAELIEELVEGGRLDELKAVAAHELTHVKLKHINYWIFLLPFNIVPFLSKWLSRSREYSCDRGAYAICKNKDHVIQALIKLATGKLVAKEVDAEEYMEQPKTEKGFFTWFAKITSTHPIIPYRVKKIREMEI